MVTRYGEQQPFIRNVFTLHSCDPIDGCRVLSYDTESEMLKQWADFIKEVDPDVIIGFNIARFDLPYLLSRSKALGLAEDTIFNTGRLVGIPVHFEETNPRQRKWEEAPHIYGRLLFDLLHYAFRYCPAVGGAQGAYRLGSVCQRILGETKEDVKFTEIDGLQSGDGKTRRRMAIYCCKDAYLPQRLLDEASALERYAEDARKALLPFDTTLSLSTPQLLKYSRQMHDITDGILKPTRSYF